MDFSYWERSSFLSNIDFIVIGAGIVGLNAALALRKAAPKARIVVLERGALPTGASSKNAGFACFGSASELLDDLKAREANEVWALVAQRYDGLGQLRQLLGDANIGYQPSGNYELFAPKDGDLYGDCLQNLGEFNAQMREITGQKDVFQSCTKAEIKAQGLSSKNVENLIINRAEGQVHTGKLLRQLWKLALQQDIDVFCGVEVKSVAFDGKNATIEATIETAQLGQLRAPRLIVATNGFARQLLPQLEVKPARNQVLVTRPLPNLALKGCFHYDKGYIYFRNLPDNRILLGGGRNLDIAGETTFDFGNTAPILDYLNDFLNRTIELPNIEIDYHWSGILGIGETKKPIIEKVNAATTVAVRLGGMGVAIGTAVGRQAAELALEG